jgi:hypothetical protein
MKDEVSSTFRHHDSGRVDVGAGDQGENARICHPETVYEYASLKGQSHEINFV